MYFDSLSSLFSMGGHGLFVWSAVLITVLFMSLLLIMPLWATRQFFIRHEKRLRKKNGVPPYASHS